MFGTVCVASFVSQCLHCY